MGRTPTLIALFALGRLVFGAGLAAGPERVASGWLGRDARREAVKIAIRAVGARDVALSAGTIALGGGSAAVGAALFRATSR